MTDQTPSKLLDSFLSEASPVKGKGHDRELLDALFEKSSQKELNNLRSYITQQVEAGVYNPQMANEILNRLRGLQSNGFQPHSTEAASLLSNVMHTPKSGHNTYRSNPNMSFSFDATPHIDNSPFASVKPIIVSSLLRTLSLILLRSKSLGFKRIQEQSIRTRVDHHWKDVMASGGPAPNQFMSTKIKARIIWALYRNRPKLTVNSAFYRWKVHSDPILVKEVVDRFALYSKLNMTVALWRMKSVLTSRAKEEALRRRLMKQQKASKILSAILNKIAFRNLTFGFSSIKDYVNYIRLVKQSLDKISRNFRLTKQKAFEIWLHAMGKQNQDEQTKKLMRVLGGTIDLVRKAFNKWRNETIFDRLQKLKQGSLGVPKIYRILSFKLRNNLKDAFDALNQERLASEEERQLRSRLADYYSKGFRILEIQLKNLEKRLLRSVFMTIKESYSEEEYSKMKVVQKLIFRNEIRLRDSLKIWKMACELDKIIKTNNLTRQLFSIAASHLLSSTAPLFKIEKENQKRTTLKLLVYSTRNKLLQAFIKWRTNCNVKHITSEHEKIRNATYLTFLLNKLYYRRCSDAISEIFHFVKEKKTEKMKVVVKMLLNASSPLKHYFRLWSFKAREISLQERSVQLSHLFKMVNNYILRSTTPIYGLPKEMESKRKSLKWIFNHYDNLKKRAFYMWTVRSLKRRLHYELNLGQKLNKTDQLAFRLDFMYRRVIGDAFTSLKKVIHDHKLMARTINAMQRSVFDRLKVAFLTWKNFNYRLRDENTKTIVFSIKDLRWKHLLWGFSGIRDEYLRKNNIMRKALQKMETSSKFNSRFYFYRWMKATEMMRLFDKLCRTTKLFQIVNSGLKTHTEAFLQGNRAREKKEKAFNKLFINARTRMNEMFHLWHDRAMMLKNLGDLKQEIKLQLLNKLAVVHNKCVMNDMNYYFKKWKGKYQKDILKRRVINRFLNTTFGLKLLAFQRWKNMCDKVQISRNVGVSTLQRVLFSLHRRLLRTGFEAIQQTWHEVNDQKVVVVRKLISLSQSDIKRYFNLWASNTRNLKHIQTCKQVVQLFNVARATLRSQLVTFMGSNPVVKKKQKNVVRFFLKSFNTKLRQSFNTWRDFARVEVEKEAIIEEKKEVLFTGVENWNEKIETNLLREAFSKLKRLNAAADIKRRFFVGVYKTNFGMLQNAFNHWKYLPKPEDPTKKAAIGSLAYQLNKIYELSLKKGFDPLKELWFERNEVKRKAVQLFITATQDDLKRIFFFWKNNAKDLTHALLCRKTLILFENLNFGLKNHFSTIVQAGSKQEKKSKLIFKVERNIKLLMHDALLRWKEKASHIKTSNKIREDRKLEAATLIAEWIDERRMDVLRQSMKDFANFDKKKKLLKQTLLALFKTQSGQLYQAFEKWKLLPAKSTNLAQATGQSLAFVVRRIMSSKMKDAFDKLKVEWIVKNDVKKTVLKKLIWSGKGKLRQAFEKWVLFERCMQKVEVLRETQKLFELMRLHLKEQLHQFAGNVVISDRKKGAVQLFARTFLSRSLGHFFHRWYLVTKMTALDTQRKVPNLLNLIQKNRQAVLKEAFERLKTRNSKVLFRRFTGLLDKWFLKAKKEAFSEIQEHYRLYMQRKHMLAVNKLLRYMKLYQQSALYTSFTTWRNNSLHYNPWFKKSMGLIAKNSHITYQIAFWRLRDSITADGAHIDSKQYNAMKKIFNYVRKRYEITLSRAFLQINSAHFIDRANLGVGPILTGDDNKNLSEVAPSSLRTTQVNTRENMKFDSPQLSEIPLDEEERKKLEKHKMFVLRLVVKNYLLASVDPTERLIDAFQKWKLHAGHTKSAVYGALQNKMDKQELAYLAKLGSLQLIQQKIEFAIKKAKRAAFEALAQSSATRLEDQAYNDEVAKDEVPQNHIHKDHEVEDQILTDNQPSQDHSPQDQLPNKGSHDQASEGKAPQNHIHQTQISNDEKSFVSAPQNQEHKDQLSEIQVPKDEVSKAQQDLVSQGQEVLHDSVPHDQAPKEQALQNSVPEDQISQNQILQDPVVAINADSQNQEHLPQDFSQGQENNSA